MQIQERGSFPLHSNIKDSVTIFLPSEDMANKQSKSGPKTRKRRHLDSEDRRALLEKKALKKQKKLEFGAKLAETHQVKKAIAAAQTVAIDDVIRAIQSKGPSTRSKPSTASTGVSVDSLLSGLGVGRKVENLAWSSDEDSHAESEPDYEMQSDYSSDDESLVHAETEISDEASPESSQDEEDEDDDIQEEEESDGESSTASESAVVGFHKRVSFPSDIHFTKESQDFISNLISKDKRNLVLSSEEFHQPGVARSCYLGLTAHLVSHILTKVHRMEKNNQKLKKSNINLSDLGTDSPFRDQGPNRARVCLLAPFRSNCFEIVQNILTLLELTPEQVGNGENFFQEYEGQDTRNMHAKNWEDWRRELFKGHYDDNNYDDFIVGITFGFGKVKLFFPKTADKLCHMDMIIASPLALSRIAAEDHKTVKKHEKQKRERLDIDQEEDVVEDEEETEDTAIPMDFLSGLEILVIDRIDALSMQNWDNLVDVVSAANRKPIATISADIDRIEEKFLEESSDKHRQTLLICGSVYSDKFAQVLSGDQEPTFVGTLEDSWSGTPLNRALKHGIKQQFFINVPDVMEYFRSKYWKDIGGDEIRGLIIVVSHEHNYDELRDFLENNEGITDCYLHETEIASHRRKLKEILKNFKTGNSRLIVVSERLLWYQRIRVLTGTHVLFFGVPVNDSVYADILSDIEDSSRCTSVCLHRPDEVDARRRIVGSKNQTENIPRKVVVFTSN